MIIEPIEQSGGNKNQDAKSYVVFDNQLKND